jgi:hypothetical protein
VCRELADFVAANRRSNSLKDESQDSGKKFVMWARRQAAKLVSASIDMLARGDKFRTRKLPHAARMATKGDLAKLVASTNRFLARALQARHWGAVHLSLETKLKVSAELMGSGAVCSEFRAMVHSTAHQVLPTEAQLTDIIRSCGHTVPPSGWTEASLVLPQGCHPRQGSKAQFPASVWDDVCPGPKLDLVLSKDPAVSDEDRNPDDIAAVTMMLQAVKLSLQLSLKLTMRTFEGAMSCVRQWGHWVYGVLLFMAFRSVHADQLNMEALQEKAIQLQLSQGKAVKIVPNPEADRVMESLIAIFRARRVAAADLAAIGSLLAQAGAPHDVIGAIARNAL